MFFLLPLTLNLDCKIDKRDYLTIMQGYTYKVEVNMFDNDSPLDLTNAVINIDFMKADKKFIIQTKDITISGNKVSFNTDSDFSNISGKAKIQIIVKKDGFIYGSWVVDVVIKPSAINDNDGQSENKLTITQDLKDTIAKAESDIKTIPIEAEKKINELTSQANTSIDTLKANTQKTLTDLTNQANTSINSVSSNADAKINALITKSNETIAKLEQAVIDGDVEEIQHEVFDKEYLTFTTNKSVASVGESEISGLMTLEEPMFEEEPTEEENGIMTLEEPMLLANTTTTPIKTGIPRSATLKGKTLVNLFKNSELNYEFSHTNSTTSNVYGFLGRNDLIMNLDKNKVYYIIEQWQITDRTDKTSTINFQPKVFYENGSETYLNYNTSFYIGIHTIKRKIQFPKNVTGFHLGLVNAPNDTVKGKILGCVIVEYQDGMENWDIPYFEGMASVVNPSATSVGKNLYDSKTMKSRWWLAVTSSGVWSLYKQDLGNDYSIIVPAKEGEQYSLSGENITRYIYAFLDESYNTLLIQSATYSYLKTKTAPSGTKYLMWYINHESVDKCDNIQVEVGTVSTEYEPYKSNTVTTSEEVILRSLPNGVCDTLNLLTGEYVQNTNEKQFTENDTWYQTTMPLTPSNSVFYTPLNGIESSLSVHRNLFDTLGFYNNTGSTCNYALFDGKRCIAMHQNGNIYFSLPTSELTSDNVEGWKTFLRNNTLKLAYQQVTPIVKTVDLTGLPFIFEDGHILLSADSILPTLEYTVVTTLKGQGENTAEELLDVKLNKLDKTEKASDSALLNGVKEDTSVTGNTIVKRDSYGGAKFKNLTMNNNNSLYGTTTGGGTVSLAYLSNTNKTVYGAITNGMLLRSQSQPLLNVAGTEKEILSQHNLPIESGTFTPNIKTITSGVSFTLNEDTFGRYQRIGNKVFINMRIAWTTKNNAPTGEGVVIGGLPYAPKYSYETLTIGLYHGLGLPASALELVTHTSSGNGGIVLYYTQSASNWLVYTPQHINNEGSIAISGFYTI